MVRDETAARGEINGGDRCGGVEGNGCSEYDSTATLSSLR
jgi:hypothetical protein